MKKFLCAVIIFLFTAAPAYAAFQPDQWQYSREVAASKEGFVLIATDKNLLEHTQKGLSDVRLTDESGLEIPYQVVRNEPPGENAYPSALINVVTRPDISSLTLDLSQTGLLNNEIDLEVQNSQDYLRDVLVEGSNDNSTWSVVKKDKLFYVPPDFKKSSLSYNPVSFRYLRLTIDCSGKKPLEITGAAVKYIPPGDTRPPEPLPENQEASGTNPRTNNTELVIDLGTKGYQVAYINLSSGGQNFNRLVDVYESADAKDWSPLASDRIYDYQWSGYQSHCSRINIRRSTGRYIKAVIHNQDSPPLDIDAQVYGEAPKLLANLSAGKYTLWYGNPQASQPQYDISQFSQLIDKAGMETLRPGPEQANPAFRKKISPANNRRLLNAAVIIAAAVIGFIILKNLRSRPAQ